ncbi:MAG: hypothetical protein KDN05_20750, partial [Verrucomicrobiae bacterium]|nr:hypothetical protein [Verrucomicrobiae bacterium]
MAHSQAYGVRYLESTTPPYLTVEYFAAPSAPSIRGAVSAPAGGGLIRVSAVPVGGGTVLSTVLTDSGPYEVAGLQSGESYLLFAFRDDDGDGWVDPLEWVGVYAGNPVIVAANVSDIDILIVSPLDSDGDGMPDAWEQANGLDPSSSAGVDGAAGDLDGDGLSNVQEYWNSLPANRPDADGDGLPDGVEVAHAGTSPYQTDTDGDGMPDQWEVDHGLDPLRDDREEDRDFDFLSNWEEFTGGLNPANFDSDGNGVPDYRQVNGKTSWDAIYDRTDRLLGVRHERGASFGYQYDGNSNLIRQVKLGRDEDGDGLSDLWEFANGLDPKSADGVNGLAGDLDGDGWTNFQESLANSDPSSAADKPGVDGMILGSFGVPFLPTEFISAAGQLDGSGSEEFLVGADGDPGNETNFVKLYSEGGSGWRDESIEVGSYGVTSAAIGPLPGGQGAIYLGLRKPGGTGKVLELTRNGAGGWQSKEIVEVIGEAAYVVGLRPATSGGDLVFSGATRF